MKLALFSDIHANLPAMEAFFKDVDARRPDAIYCLGDLVGYNTWPNEVITEIRKRKIPTLAGNHDVKIRKDIPNADGSNYAYHIIDEDGKAYLKSLPDTIRLEYRFNRGPQTILLVHGSPESNEEYVLEGLDVEYVTTLLRDADADILFCAHSHLPYHRIIKKPDGYINHVINTGSIGKPKDGDPRGGYVLLTLDENSSPLIAESVEVEFIRFDYDVEAAAKAVENSPLPNEFADRLRKAY